MANPDRFPQAEITITLTGEEWTVILARCCGQAFSMKGRATYALASDKLGRQLLAAQKRSQLEIVK